MDIPYICCAKCAECNCQCEDCRQCPECTASIHIRIKLMGKYRLSRTEVDKLIRDNPYLMPKIKTEEE